MNILNNACLKIGLLLVFGIGRFSWVSATESHNPNIYFIGAKTTSNNTSYFLTKAFNESDQRTHLLLTYGPGEFINCDHEKIIYVNINGEVIQVDFGAMRNRILGKTAFKPSHELRNKLIYKAKNNYFIAATNSISQDLKVESFELIKYFFDETTQVLYKGTGHLSAIEALDSQNIRMHFIQSSIDFSIKSGEVSSTNKSRAFNFEDLLLFRPKLLIFANENNGLSLRDKIGGGNENINDNWSFLLPLDYSETMDKLLYLRVRDLDDKSGTDVLLEFDRKTLKKKVVGNGSPIIDACYQSRDTPR